MGRFQEAERIAHEDQASIRLCSAGYCRVFSRVRSLRLGGLLGPGGPPPQAWSHDSPCTLATLLPVAGASCLVSLAVGGLHRERKEAKDKAFIKRLPMGGRQRRTVPLQQLR